MRKIAFCTICALCFVLFLSTSAYAEPSDAVVFGAFEYSMGNPVVAHPVVVEAKIGGESYGLTATTIDNQYEIHVKADNLTTRVKDGGVLGDKIVIYFSGYAANETVVFPGNGTAVRQNLYIHHPPQLDPIGDQTINETETLTFTVSAIDIDQDPLTYYATPLPEGVLLNPTTGEFSWTPAAGQAGTYEVTISASDGDPETLDDTETINIAVTAKEAPPETKTITGVTFYDDNKNGKQDAEEKIAPRSRVIVEIEGIRYVTKSDIDGLYSIDVPLGENGELWSQRQKYVSPRYNLGEVSTSSTSSITINPGLQEKTKDNGKDKKPHPHR